jgi:hypothetical protein
MADINHIITLGIGTPGAILEFITVGLQIGAPPAYTPAPADRTFTPALESRTITPALESRTYTPPAETRTITI